MYDHSFTWQLPFQNQVEDALLPIAQAEAEVAKAEGGPPALIFFTVKSEASLPQQVRNVCDLKTVSDSPQVCVCTTCVCRLLKRLQQ